MDFDLPADDDPRRLACAQWLADQPVARRHRPWPTAGYVVPHWPKPWGLDADPIHQIIIDDELRKAGVNRPMNPIGIGWAGPTIAYAGTEEQKAAVPAAAVVGRGHLVPALQRARRRVRPRRARYTRAIEDGDEWVVNGQKIWTSLGHIAKFGILIARTEPDQPKHQGVSYFVCPMDLPGIEVRPIIEMTGAHLFNEVFFTDVRIPKENLIGPKHGGWALAKVTLGNERVSLSGEGALWGRGPDRGRPHRVRARRSDVTDPIMRQRLACGVHGGGDPAADPAAHGVGRDQGSPAGPRGVGPQGAGRRARPAHHERGQGSVGRATACSWTDDQWHYGYLFAPALTIGGGTSRGPAQHHRRTCARPASRHRRRSRQNLAGDAAPPDGNSQALKAPSRLRKWRCQRLGVARMARGSSSKSQRGEVATGPGGRTGDAERDADAFAVGKAVARQPTGQAVVDARRRWPRRLR